MGILVFWGHVGIAGATTLSVFTFLGYQVARINQQFDV